MRLDQALVSYGLVDAPRIPVLSADGRPALGTDEREHEYMLQLNELRTLQYQRQSRLRPPTSASDGFFERVRHARIAWLEQEIARGV